jgi:hypothetical protein
MELDYLMNLIRTLLSGERYVTFWQLKKALSRAGINVDKKVLLTRINNLNGSSKISNPVQKRERREDSGVDY